MSAGEVDTAEVAFAGCEEVDKLQYMLYIKQLPTKEARLAELALYRHNASEAEAILLQVALAKACRHLCEPYVLQGSTILQNFSVVALSAAYAYLTYWLKAHQVLALGSGRKTRNCHLPCVYC